MAVFPDFQKDIVGLEELFDNLKTKGIEVKEKREFLEMNAEVSATQIPKAVVKLIYVDTTRKRISP
jgi:hypothetical protein